MGHRSYDLGQMNGDLCGRKAFQGCRLRLVDYGRFHGWYRSLSEDMAFRTVIHAGVK